MNLSDLDVAESVLELIGKTPIVQLTQIAPNFPCPILAKVETTNPGGSSKDRPALAMINAAERDGLLKPGGTIIEPTSGNTGVGLAIVAAQRGYKCIFVMTDKVSDEKVSLLKAYGSEVIICPGAVEPDDPQSYYSTAERLMNETPGAFQPNQYHNLNNPLSHYETTGPEIWEQTKGRITHFVAGGGTGGTISGVGKYLKEQNQDIKIVLADPENSVFSGGSGRPYLVEGVGEDFWPTAYDPDIVDITIPISDAESFSMAQEVTQKEGLLIGGSCGTAVAAVLKLSDQLSIGDLVVVFLPDSGRGYLSKIFNYSWMTKMGFSSKISEEKTVSDLLKNKDSKITELIYIEPSQSANEALLKMEKNKISQLPVASGKFPISAAEVIGSVSIKWLKNQTDEKLKMPIKTMMQPPLEIVGIKENLSPRIIKLFEKSSAALVMKEGKPLTVISEADLLNFIESTNLNI